MPTGPRHGRWKGGKRIHQKGYVEITAGKYRWWKEHRSVMDALCQEWNCYTGCGRGLKQMGPATGIHWHIHHQDFDKQHNDPQNLILMDSRLHNGHQNYNSRPRRDDGTFALRYVPGAPDWVNEDLNPDDWDDSALEPDELV